MATQVWQRHDVNIGLTYTRMSDRARVDVCEIVATSDLLTYFSHVWSRCRRPNACRLVRQDTQRRADL